MITPELQKKIIKAISERRANYPSDAKMATFLGISSSQYSRIMNGDTERVLSNENWITIARKLDVKLRKEIEWVSVRTPVFEYITAQLETCQKFSISAILCDLTDIGKTHTAKEYVKKHPNSVYIDCSQYKSKQKLIRAIANEFGLGYTGKYNEVYENLVFFLKSVSSPLVVLDEFGDLDYTAMLEVKAIWNATEGTTAWYGLGAEGLEKKLIRGYSNEKVGFAELLSRFGVHDDRVKTKLAKYQKIVPCGDAAKEDFIKTHVAMIAKANGAKNIQKIYAETGGSLRDVRTAIIKEKLLG